MKTAQDGLEWYKEVLEENSSDLVEKLSLGPLFLASMVSKKVLTSQEVEDLEDVPIKSERAWKLVKLMQKKSSRNFLAFLDILKKSSQRHIAEKLAADIKYKSKYNDSERCAQENINKYVHMNLGQSTHISISDQKKFASELVLQTDYQYVNSVNKKLLQEIEELNDDLKEEKREHQMTRDQLNDMIKQCKIQLGETEKAIKQNENLEREFKKSLEKIKQLQQEKTALREELDGLRENMVHQMPSQPEQSDGDLQEMKETHEKEVAKMSDDITKLQAVIREQEKGLKAMNNKIYSIMHDIPTVQSDSCEDQSPNMSSLECLDHILAHFNTNTTSTQKSTKHKASKEKRMQLYKQLEDMNKTMQERQDQWEKERQEAREREKAMVRNINNYKQDIRNLKKKVEELNTPTPETTRGRSDSLTSVTTLPQVDMLQSFMTAPQHPKKPVRRQASNDTIKSLPVFPRPALAPMTSHSLPHVSSYHREQPLQCAQCLHRINRTELITASCQYHTGAFNGVQQRWQCCQHPYRHPGCRTGRHQLKK